MKNNNQKTRLSFCLNTIIALCACLLSMHISGCYSPSGKVLIPNKRSNNSAKSLFWYRSLNHRPALIAELLSSELPFGVNVGMAQALLHSMDYVVSNRDDTCPRSVSDERMLADRCCYQKYFESRSDFALAECKSDSAIRISINDRMKSSTHLLGVAKDDRFLMYCYKWFEDDNGKLIAVTNTTSVSRVQVDGIIRKVLMSGRPKSDEPEHDGAKSVSVFISIWQGDAIHECIIVNPHLPRYPIILNKKGENLGWENMVFADQILRELENSVGIPFYTSIVGDSGRDPSDEGAGIRNSRSDLSGQGVVPKNSTNESTRHNTLD